MTIEYPFSLAQLAQILSALENERRNPNTKRNATKAIERNAAQIGLTAEDVFDAADGLLSGRLSAAEFRAQLRDEGCGPATFMGGFLLLGRRDHRGAATTRSPVGKAGGADRVALISQEVRRAHEGVGWPIHQL